MPFERLVEELAPDPVAGPPPAVPGHAHPAEHHRCRLSLPGLERHAALRGQPRAPAKFDLNLAVTEVLDSRGRPAGLPGRVTAAADLFDPATAGRIAERFWPGAGAVVAADPQVRVRRIQILERRSVSKLVSGWNDDLVPVRQ